MDLDINLYNTLSLKKEKFKPIKNKKIGLYTCGPTVYNFVHIGNIRTFIFEDILRRTFEYNGFKIKHIMNITDVGHLSSDADEGEDKMTLALKRENKPLTLKAMKEVADFYAERFKEDIKNLNIKMPSLMPKASEHIKEDIGIIKRLERKGFIYKTSDGIYFDVSKFKNYGKLGRQKKIASQKYSRININPEKKNPADFALWKFNDKLGWKSPWGEGFPGWHIECSAMSTKYLGQPFDVHTGGIDHIQVHHQNEIAQSEAAYENPLAHYWLHGAFLIVDQKKMAKSDGTFITLKDIKEKGFNPIAFRYLTLGTHYRKPLNFSWKSLESAQKSLEHLYNQLLTISNQPIDKNKIDKKFKENFLKAINDDLNIPQALALIQKLLKSKLKTDEYKLSTILDFDRVLGLKIKENIAPIKIPREVEELAKRRESLRKEKKWEEADHLRKKILELGYKIEDIKKGYILKRSEHMVR
ncbi:MAG: cysteine--tRNA ligase [Patescibacteria group bacterium]